MLRGRLPVRPIRPQIVGRLLGRDRRGVPDRLRPRRLGVSPAPHIRAHRWAAATPHPDRRTGMDYRVGTVPDPPTAGTAPTTATTIPTDRRRRRLDLGASLRGAPR